MNNTKNISKHCKEVINEYNSPDNVYLFDDKFQLTDKLHFRKSDAIGFFVNLINDDFYCDYSKSHKELKFDYIAKQFGFDSNDDYNDYVDENPGAETEAMEEEYEAILFDIDGRCHNCIEGRFWLDNNIITFWYSVPSYDKLVDIIKGIESFVHQNIDVENVIIADDSDLIPVKEFFDKNLEIDKDKSDEASKIHLMNAEDKVETSQMKDFIRNRSENIGKKLQYSNLNDEMPMAQWNALHTTSENKQQNNILMKFTNKDIKRAVNEVFTELVKRNRLNEDYDDYDDESEEFESIDSYKLSQILEKYGWGYSGFDDVTNSKGEAAVAYQVYPHSSDAADINDVVKAIKNSAEDPNGIVLGSGYYRYNPNKSINVIYVKKVSPSPQMELPFESKRRKGLNEWYKEPSEPKKVLICNSIIDGQEANEIAMSEGYEKEWMGAQFWFEGTIDYESEFEPKDMPKYNQFITHMDYVDADLYYDYGANYYFAVREGNNGKNSLLQYNENKQITKSKLHKLYKKQQID